MENVFLEVVSKYQKQTHVVGYDLYISMRQKHVQKHMLLGLYISIRQKHVFQTRLSLGLYISIRQEHVIQKHISLE